MTEGKLTLPVIYALKATGDEEMIKLARKVKAHTVSQDEIAQLVAFTKENSGIEYADRRMWDFMLRLWISLITMLKTRMYIMP